jgi:prepilin-type N-terminal cleavage/methylation domain-containing protein
MNKTKGFTLIELLIVIAVLGILIVAILSAIDPLEQIRKARDAGRKSDAAELLSAYERYYSTFQCYPWDDGAPQCAGDDDADRTAEVNPWLGTDTEDFELITQGELKAQFTNRDSIQSSELWVIEDVDKNVTVCFEPESKSGREGGYGTLNGDITSSIEPNDCSSDPYAGGDDNTATCWICLPQ